MAIHFFVRFLSLLTHYNTSYNIVGNRRTINIMCFVHLLFPFNRYRKIFGDLRFVL